MALHYSSSWAWVWLYLCVCVSTSACDGSVYASLQQSCAICRNMAVCYVLRSFCFFNDVYSCGWNDVYFHCPILAVSQFSFRCASFSLRFSFSLARNNINPPDLLVHHSRASSSYIYIDAWHCTHSAPCRVFVRIIHAQLIIDPQLLCAPSHYQPNHIHRYE